MKRTLVVFSVLVAILAFSKTMKADDINDPAFVETLTNNCPANCSGVALGTDTLSGLTTVEFSLKTTGTGAIPSVVAGDILIDEFGTTTVGDVIRFENISGVAVAFIFSNDDVGLPSALPADVGLPSSYQSITTTITENSTGTASFTPTAGTPGYCASCTTAPTYGIFDSEDLPEPSAYVLLGTCMLGLCGALKRKVVA